MKNGKLILRIGIAFLGLMFCGIGVGTFLFAGMGVDPASVLMQGISKSVGISYGTASAAVNILILVIVFLVDKKYINISSLIAIFGIGYTADYTNRLLLWLLGTENSLLTKSMLLAVGLVIIGIGVATYIHADLGVGAIDLISEVISEKSGIQYRIVRIISDVFLLVAGFVLGGTVGIGTVLAAFGIGPIVQFVRPTVIRILDKQLRRDE